jgi:type I restriction-modification system DNA methylase subunit
MEDQGKSNDDRKLCYILRGSLDPADYHQPVMTLLFLKRLNDTFEENAERIIN